MDSVNSEKPLESQIRFDNKQSGILVIISSGFIMLINAILYGYTLLPNEGVRNFSLALIATTLIEFLLFDPGRFKKTWQKRLNVIVYFIVNVIKLAALLFFVQYGTYDLFSRVQQAEYLTEVTDYVFALITLPVLIYIGVVILFLLFGLIFAKKLSHIKIRERWKSYIAFAMALLLMLVFVQDMKYIEVYSALGRSAYDAKFKQSTLSSIANEDINESQFLDYIFRNHLNQNEFTGIGKDKNLLVIQVESYQGGFVGKSYRGKKITPYTDKLIEKSIYFTDYFELLGTGNSSDAEFVSLHSVYPSNNIGSYEGYTAKGINGLPKIAHARGYTTFSMHGNSGEFYNRNKEHKRVGFDEVYMGESYEQDEIIGLGLSDESFFRQSVDKIEKIAEKGKFFGFMVTLTCHGPYYMPPKDVKFNVETSLRGTPFSNYLNAVHYTDKAIGEFLEMLDERGILENTVVAIYGDHHAFVTTDADTNKHLSNFLGVPFDYDEMMKIPLVIHVPGNEQPIQKKNIGSQVDFMPTIMNIMGWNDTITPMFGVDLLDPVMSEDNIVLPQTYMRKGSFVTEDAMFEQSRASDGFEGKFIDRRTRKPLPLAEAAAERHKLVNYLVDISQVLYVHDKLDEMVESYISSGKAERKKEKVNTSE